MGFCLRHFKFYRYGNCPTCIEALVKAMPTATVAQLALRYAAVRATPTSLNQEAFGTCALTSVVYAMLRHDATIADRLNRATFADVVPAHAGSTFLTSRHGAQSISFRNLARRWWLQMNDYAHADHQQIPTPVYFVDYCLARGLGYLLKRTAAARYKREKLDFNSGFVPTNDYRQVTRAGHLALRVNNIAYVLDHIVGAQAVHVSRTHSTVPPLVPHAAQVAHATYSTYQNAAEFQNDYDTHTAAANSFAIAAVYGDLMSRAPLTAASAGHATLPFVHYVVIEGLTNVGGGQRRLQFWTWGEAALYDQTMDEAHLISYIHAVIYGHF